MKPEPRGMTFRDAMALTLGVAASIQSSRLFGGWGYVPGLVSPSVMLLISILIMSWSAGMAISFAALSRSIRYDRLPRPGEWLALLLSAYGIVSLAPNLYQRAEPPLVRATGLDFATARWLIAGLVALVILSGLGLAWLARRRLPAWVVSLVLFGLSVLAIGGPFATIQKEGPFLVNPVARLGNSPLGLFLLHCCELAAITPYLLLVAAPTMAALSRWPLRRSWAWTEWAGPILCLPTLGYPYFQRATFFREGSGFWIADQVARIAWLVAIAALARWIVGRWGRTGRDDPAQTTGFDREAASSAFTRAT